MLKGGAPRPGCPRGQALRRARFRVRAAVSLPYLGRGGQGSLGPLLQGHKSRSGGLHPPQAPSPTASHWQGGFQSLKSGGTHTVSPLVTAVGCCENTETPECQTWGPTPAVSVDPSQVLTRKSGSSVKEGTGSADLKEGCGHAAGKAQGPPGPPGPQEQDLTCGRGHQILSPPYSLAAVRRSCHR